MNKGIMWLFVAIALIIGIGIGYSVEKSRATSKMEETKMIMQKQINDETMKVDQMEKDKMMQKTTTITPAPSDAMMKK